MPVFRRLKRKSFLLITLLLMIGGIFLFQLETVPALMAGQVLIFMGMFACSVTQDLIIQESAPPEMLGRISGLLRIINSAMISLSTFFLTTLAASLSFQAIAVIVIGMILLALLLSQNQHFTSTHYQHGEHLNE
ncbi:hypothetical protein HA44_20230 [Mixta gaviniae]|nr:hypothetical protein HA44_20230 [Mixta gaviniae]